MKYFWWVFGLPIFIAAFCNLATGVLVFGYSIVVKMGFWVLSQGITPRSSRRSFYSLLTVIVVSSTVLILVYKDSVIAYWPYALVVLLLLWLITYQKSEQKTKDLARQELWLREQTWYVKTER